MSATADPAPAPTSPIPGIPAIRQHQLEQLFAAQPRLEAVWLFGSRAMGRHHEGSDLDLCLEGEELAHIDQLRLMDAIDDLLMPWQVDLALKHQLPPELLGHLQLVAQRIWQRSPSTREAQHHQDVVMSAVPTPEGRKHHSPAMNLAGESVNTCCLVVTALSLPAESCN